MPEHLKKLERDVEQAKIASKTLTMEVKSKQRKEQELKTTIGVEQTAVNIQLAKIDQTKNAIDENEKTFLREKANLVALCVKLEKEHISLDAAKVEIDAYLKKVQLKALGERERLDEELKRMEFMVDRKKSDRPQ